MPRKLKLQIEYKPEFRTIGLSSIQKDYRLSWLINQALGTDLQRLPDFKYVARGMDEPCRFPVFHHATPELKTRYFLVKNRCTHGHLLTQAKNMDYLFVLKQTEDYPVLDALLTQLRKMKDIQAAFTLDDKLDKQSTAFFYDFELYLDGII